MLGKRPQPMIGWLSELLVSGTGGGLSSNVITTKPIPSPKSPIEYKIESSRGLKNYDLGDGVGLGIIAALEKSSSRNLMSRSDPIPVANCQNFDRFEGGFNGIEIETESLENYLYVASHKHDKSYTQVYYDAGEYGKISTLCGVVSNSDELRSKFDGDVSTYPTSDFLSSCHLCQKKLHGRDIFIYRGEKAFCSVECRSRQIMVDKHKEKRRSKVVPRYVDVSSSPCTTSPIFSTGIIAT